MVECLQNVAKHAADEKTGNPLSPGRGVFMISNNENEYIVTIGNTISNKKVAIIKNMLNKFNSLYAIEIKAEYKKMIKRKSFVRKIWCWIRIYRYC